MGDFSKDNRDDGEYKLLQDGKNDLESVDISEVVSLLNHGDPTVRKSALLILNEVGDDDPTRLVPYAVPLFEQLGDTDPVINANVLYSLNRIAEQQPERVIDKAGAIVDCLSVDKCQNNAAHILVELAEHRLSRLYPHLDAVSTLLTDDDELVRQKGAKVFVETARQEPDIAKPYVSELLETVRIGTADATSVNLAAHSLASIAEEYPSAVQFGLKEMAGLLDSQSKFTRTTAVATMSYVAEEHPERVKHYLHTLIDRLEDPYDATRMNAAMVVAKLSRHDPTLLAPHRDVLSDTADNAPQYEVRRVAEICLNRVEDGNTGETNDPTAVGKTKIYDPDK